MNRSIVGGVAVVVAALVLILAYSALFTVYQTKQALVVSPRRSTCRSMTSPVYTLNGR